jgi:hypothetical protein
MSARHRRHRRRASLIIAALAALACLAFAAPASAQAPAWRIDALANSSAAPGTSFDYMLQITNVGDASTDGSEIDLVITLPDGVTGVEAGGGNFTCTAEDGVSPVAGASVIKCQDVGDVVDPQQQSQFNSIRTPVITVTAAPGTNGIRTASFALSGGGAAPVSTVTPVRITDAPPAFGIANFDSQTFADAAGNPSTQAGGHPYAITTSMDFETMTNPNPIIGPLWPVEPAKDALVDLPAGFVGNPTVADRCTTADLANSAGTEARPLCPPTAQVGTAMVRVKSFFVGLGNEIWGPIPVFNLVPPDGVPASFGFNFAGTIVTLNARVRNGGDYGISVDARDIPEGLAIAGTSLTFWGVPSDPSHDAERACPGQDAPWQQGATCQSGAPRRAFLRDTTSCQPQGASDGIVTTLTADSWFHPGSYMIGGNIDRSATAGSASRPNPDDPNWRRTESVSHLPPSYPAPTELRGPHRLPQGCSRVPFDPTFTVTPDAPARASSPSGFSFDLALPQSDNPDVPGEGDLKKAVVTLPAGVRVSPSSAQGLGACSEAQIALHSADDASCPDASKIGSVRIDTPLLEKPLTGAIYLATPHANPFGTLLAIYLVAKGSGVIVKLPGKVDADAATGQLTATFDDNPQLPFSDVHLVFDSGPRAPLVTPATCGTYPTHAVLTSWSGKRVVSDGSFAIDHGPDGGPCAPLRFTPTFAAGSVNPIAGGDSSFLLEISRDDRDQQLGAVAVDMPQGLTGRIASAVLCPEAAARAGTCEGVSKIGTVAVGAGAGPNPFYITNGRAYLTGPYNGAPFGLSMVVPAIAGPFDLGTVVVRAAIFVNRRTSQLKVVSDRLPTILQGIPLDLRDVRVAIDRSRFIVNPTSCAEKHVFGTITSVAGAVAHAADRFEVTDCARLPLAPRMTLTVGARHRTRARISTPLTATLTQTPGQANLRVVTVVLPTTLDALLPVLNRACSLAQFEAGHCGRAARVGSAVAVTPLLRDPLRGAAFFVRKPHRLLPDLMVALRGQVAIDLTGKVSIGRGNRLRTSFDTIPDVPIRKFALRLVAGRNGPLGTTTNLCSAKARRARASIAFRAQNGRTLNVRPRLRVLGCRRTRR